MKYYKFWDRFGKLRGGETYVELDKGYVMRQISMLGEEMLASNRRHPAHGYYLPTGYIDYAAFNQLHTTEIEAGLIKPITTVGKKNFESVWSKHLKRFYDDWVMAQQSYAIGTRVTGKIEAFYPQGVILELAPGVCGIADYDRCRAVVGQTLVPNLPLSVVVNGYIDEMQWIKLIQPEMEKPG